MQEPTLKNVRIRSTRDALHVFYGVAMHKLPLINRRLDAEERRAIAPGNVYVWEERGANTESTGIGMERWTDGMGWGPSRVRDEFLFYHQKESELGEDANTASTPWAQMISVYPANHARGTSESERFIKQTYSVHVSLPQDRTRGVVRKWHLTAYYTQQRLDTLATLDSIAGVGDVDVPEGLFRSARAGKTRRDHRELAPKPPQPPADSAIGLQIKPPTSLLNDTPPNARPYASARRQLAPAARFVADDNNSKHHPLSSPPSHQYAPPYQKKTKLPLAESGQLVPLQYLEAVAYPRRDPTDEQLLRRFSLHPLTTSFRRPQSTV